MGKFANKLEGQTGALAHQQRLPWSGQSGWDAMGHTVPAFRKSAAERHAKEMGVTSAEQRYFIVAKMSACIERDDTHEALELCLREGVDATGAYRLLSVLLTAAKPVVRVRAV